MRNCTYQARWNHLHERQYTGCRSAIVNAEREHNELTGCYYTQDELDVFFVDEVLLPERVQFYDIKGAYWASDLTPYDGDYYELQNLLKKEGY